jgi:LytS/YehU family sensor histidine kinase
MVIRIPKRIVETFWFRLLAAVIVGGILYWIASLLVRNRRIATQQLEDSLRMESLRGQMNPHFIFNSLNSINYFISKNDKISANSFIADFSRLIRQTLENLSAGHVPFEVELSSVSDYLKLEHMRFGDRFSYSIQADEIVDPERIEVVPGLVQPFIENSIWHGIRGLQGRTGRVSVTFRPLRPDALECIIEDDGIGCHVSGETRIDLPGKKPQGVRIVKERLQILSKTKGAAYTMEMSDLYPDRTETGTRVRVLIPVKTDKK